MRSGILTTDPVEFLWHYHQKYDKEELRTRVQKHIEYKTCRIILDKDGFVCAVCLWNIEDHGHSAHIIDLAIREDKRKTDMMRKILRNGMQIWPVEFLVFERNYDGRRPGKKVWSTERFLRRKG